MTSQSGIAGPSAGSSGSSPPPPTTFQELPLYSSQLEDWKFHLMRFASHAKVDPSETQQFPWPVKLNRKWPPKPKDPLPRAGDPVIDQFGKPVMVPAQKRDPNMPEQKHLTAAERKRIPLLWPAPDDDAMEIEELVSRLEVPKGPQADASLIGPSSSSNNATRAKAGLFKKRVREIHKASAAARRTHNEEALPWILEDYETQKEWESRRKESRRGLIALKQGIETRKKGGQFPTLARDDDLNGFGVKSEEDNKADVKLDMSSTNQNHAPWIGKLEGEAHESGSTSSGGAMSHALFVFDERGAGAFRVVPVSRMYKFLQRPKHANRLSWEEAEKEFERHQKARFGEGSKFEGRNHSLNGSRPADFDYAGRYENSKFGKRLAVLPGASGGFTGVKTEFMDADYRPNVADMYNPNSFQRRQHFVSVSKEPSRSIRVKEEEGTFGEVDFEEDFADDEERHEGDDFALGEEEAKELEQKIKREMARAEEQEEENDDLFGSNDVPGHGENDVLTGSGKQMKKIMKALARREGNEAYEEDDEDRNPYISDDEDSDIAEESALTNPEEALKRVREEREREQKEAAKAAAAAAAAANGSTSGTGTDANASVAQSKAASKQGSRSGTPAPNSRPTTATRASAASGQNTNNSINRRPGAGHANVAQRATSPKAGSRSASPVRDGGNTPNSLKRKSESNRENAKRMRTTTSGTAGTYGTISNPQSPQSASPPRSASPSRSSYRGSISVQPLNDLEKEIVAIVRDGKAKTTKELIQHFSLRLNSQPDLKKKFSEAASRVLMTKKPEGTLGIRPGIAGAE